MTGLTTSGYPELGAIPTHISTSTGTLIKTGEGIFFGLSINTPQSGDTATVYDGIDNTGTVIGIYSTAAQGVLPFPAVGVHFAVGLYVITAGATPADITVLAY